MDQQRTCPPRPGGLGQSICVRAMVIPVVVVLLLSTIGAVRTAVAQAGQKPVKLNERSVDSMLDGAVKPVVFRYEPKYEKERQIVRKIIKIAKYERIPPGPGFPEGYYHKARIGIASEDLNRDGRPDILACVHHTAYGPGCRLFVFVRSGDGTWKRVLELSTFGRVFLSHDTHKTYEDIVLQGPCTPVQFRPPGCRERETYRFDGKKYRWVLGAEIQQDSAAGVHTITIPSSHCYDLGIVDVR